MAVQVNVIYNLVNKVSKEADRISSTLDKLEDSLKNVDKRLDNLERSTGKDLPDSMKKMQKSLENNDLAVKALERDVKQLNTTLGNLDRSFGRASDGSRRFESSSSRAGSAARGLDNVINSLLSSVFGLSGGINDLNLNVDGTSRGSNRAASSLRGLSGAARGAGGPLTTLRSTVRGLSKDLQSISTAFAGVATYGFFKAGTVRALEFFQQLSAIALITPAVSAALGGLTQIVGALGIGIAGLVGSVGRLITGLGLLPGIIGAVGAGMIGMGVITKSFIKPAVDGTKQLKDLDKQIAKAGGSLAKAKEEAKKADRAQELAGLATARGQSAGLRRKLANGEDPAKAVQDVADAQSALNDLYEKQAEILKTMPPLAAEIAKAVEDLQDGWRKLWFANPQGLVIARAILDTVKNFTWLLKQKEITDSAMRLGAAIKYIAGLLQTIVRGEGFRMMFGARFGEAVANFRWIAKVIKDSLPYMNVFMKVMSGFTHDILKAADGWLLNRDNLLKFKDTLESIFNSDQFINSFKAWMTAIGNVVSGFREIAGKGKLIERFEKGMVGITGDFKEWAKGLKAADVERVIGGAFKILSAIGGVLKGMGRGIGAVLGDPKAVELTVEHLGQLANGLEKFGKYMASAIVAVGPSMIKFWRTFGQALDGKGDSINNAARRTIDLLSRLVDLWDMLTPDWVVEWILSLRGALFVLGLGFGMLLTPVARLVGLFMLLGQVVLGSDAAIRGLNAAVKGGGIKEIMAAVRDESIAGKAVQSLLRISPTGHTPQGTRAARNFSRFGSPDTRKGLATLNDPMNNPFGRATGKPLPNIGVIPSKYQAAIEASSGVNVPRTSSGTAEQIAQMAKAQENLAAAARDLKKAEIDLSKVAAHRRPVKDWFGNWTGPGKGEAGSTRPFFGLLGEERSKPLGEVTARDNIRAAEAQHKLASKASKQAEKAAKRAEKAQKRALYQQKAVRAEYGKLWNKQISVADNLASMRAKELAQEQLVTALHWDRVHAQQILEEGRGKRVMARWRQFNRVGFPQQDTPGQPIRIHRLGVAVAENERMEKAVLKVKKEAYKDEYKRLEAIRRERAHLEAISKANIAKLDSLRKESKLWAGKVKAATSEVDLTRDAAAAAKESLDAAHAKFASTKYDYELMQKANKEKALAAKNEHKAARKKLKDQQKIYKQALREEAVAAKNLRKAERAQQRALGKQWKDAEKAQKASDKVVAKNLRKAERAQQRAQKAADKVAAKAGKAGKAGDQLSLFDDPLGGLKKPFKELSTMGKVARVLGTVVKVLSKVFFWVGIVIGGLEGLSDNTLGIRDDFNDLIDTLTRTLFPAFKRLWDALNGGTSDGSGGILGAINEVFKLFGSAVFGAFITTLDGAAQVLASIVNIAAAIVEPISAVVDSVVAVFDFLTNGFDVSQLKSDLSSAWEGVWDSMYDAAVEAGKALGREVVQALVIAGVLGRGPLGGVIGGPVRRAGGKGREMAKAGAAQVAARKAGKGAVGRGAASVAGRGVAKRAIGGAAGLLAPESLGASLALGAAAWWATDKLFDAYDKAVGNADKNVKDATIATYGLNDAEEIFAAETLSKKDRAVLQAADDLINATKKGPSVAEIQGWGYLSDEQAKAIERATKAAVPTDATIDNLNEMANSQDTIDKILKDAGISEDSLGYGSAGEIVQTVLGNIAQTDFNPDIAAAEGRLKDAEDAAGRGVDIIKNEVRVLQKAAADIEALDKQKAVVEFKEAVAFGGLQKKTAAEQAALDVRERRADAAIRLAEINRLMTPVEEEDVIASLQLTPAQRAALPAEAAKLRPLANAGREAYNAAQGGGATGQSAEDASSMTSTSAGYAGNTSKGAKMAFDPGALRTFRSNLRTNTQMWKANFNTMVAKTVDARLGIARQMRAISDNLLEHSKDTGDTIAANALKVGEAINDGIRTPLKGIVSFLNTIFEEANAILKAAGAPEMVKGQAPSGSGTGSPAAAPRDSNRPPTTALGGGSASPGNTSGMDLLKLLDNSIQASATALINDIPGGAAVYGTREPRPGNPGSQHPSGMAIDMGPSPFSIPAANAMGQWIQAHAAAYGVNPSQVFYPSRPAAVAGDHNDHVHVGFGGAGSGMFGGIDMSTLSEVPDFGTTVGGRIGTAIGTRVREALMALGTSGSSLGVGDMFSGDLADMIRSAALAYGANPAGLLAVANAESTMNPNAVNNWDSNAMAGTPSRGLFQFIETTFASMMPQARAANPAAWFGVSTNWLDPMAQALTAAWAFTHGQGGHWTTANLYGGSYGDGGDFIAKRPQLIQVGDKQPERVTVSPTRGPAKGKHSGGKTTVIHSTINLGTLIANDEGIEQLTEAIGKQFRDDLSTAMKNSGYDDEG